MLTRLHQYVQEFQNCFKLLFVRSWPITASFSDLQHPLPHRQIPIRNVRWLFFLQLWKRGTYSRRPPIFCYQNRRASESLKWIVLCCRIVASAAEIKVRWWRMAFVCMQKKNFDIRQCDVFSQFFGDLVADALIGKVERFLVFAQSSLDPFPNIGDVVWHVVSA